MNILTFTMGNSDKNEVVMLEQQMTRDEGILKPVPIVKKTDYSGAYEKTDPREIALVKKLDRWIMPMLWSMYWLNYLVSLPRFSPTLIAFLT